MICPEGNERVREYWQKEALPFIGLADPTHTVAELYGQQVKLLKLGRLPAVVIVDKSGQIYYQHLAGGMSDIPSVSDLLETLDKQNPMVK